MWIGSTYPTDKEYLIEDDTLATNPSKDVTNNEQPETDNYNILIDDIYEASLQWKIDLDELLISADHNKKHDGFDSDHVYRTWKIDIEAAKRTRRFTT